MINIIQTLVGVVQETAEELFRQGNIKGSITINGDDFVIPSMRWQGDLSTPALIKAETSLERSTFLQKFLLGLEKRKLPFLEKIEVVPPGYLNFFLKTEVLTDNLKALIKNNDFGIEKTGENKKVLLEFVSANPTGPLTIAHGRQAAFGEALARIMTECGYQVKREYYLNDEGKQIDLLGESLKARYRQILGENVPLPKDGYHGEYLRDMAKSLFDRFGENLKEKEIDFFSKIAMEEIMKTIREDLRAFGVEFDSFQSQKMLSETGQVSETLKILEEKGALFSSEGALFLRTTPLGDDKDRVVRKKDGTYTYLAPDLAYHRSKFLKGYDLMVNLWGPDHFGYVKRLLAGISLLGFDPNKIKIIIVQLTTLYRGKERIKMSTRQGEFLPLSLLTRELTVDVTKFFFLSRKASSHLDFDLELAKKDSSENPIFYLQYASARIASLFRYQKEMMPMIDIYPEKANLTLLNKPEEREIMLFLSRFGITINTAARNLEPQILFAYLLSLAKVFHQYYQRYRIIGPEKELTLARLVLVHGVERVLRKGLFLLNVNAPEKM